MKKILFMILASFLVFGCELKQENKVTTGVGDLSLEVTCSEEGFVDKPLIKSSASINTDEFTVFIEKLENEFGEAVNGKDIPQWTGSWTLGKFPSLLELAPGKFKIVIASPQIERTRTDVKTFYAEEVFYIREDEVTPLQIEVGVSNMMITLAPTENFFNELADFTVTVTAEYEGVAEPVSISWTQNDVDKVAFIEPVPFSVMVTGHRKIDGSEAQLKEPYKVKSVSAKDHHILNIDVQVTGEVDTKGNGSFIQIIGTMNPSTEVEITVPGVEEVPVPDDNPEEDDDKVALPYLTWELNPNFAPIEVTTANVLKTSVNLVVHCPGKIAEFVITCSPNFADEIIPGLTEKVPGEEAGDNGEGVNYLDLIKDRKLQDFFSNPQMYLPTGNALLGQTEVNFVLDNLASLVPAVAYNVGDETVFTLNIKDELGQTCVKSIKFITVAQ